MLSMLPMTKILTPTIIEDSSRRELNQARARFRHLFFMQHCWQRSDPFIRSKQFDFQTSICSHVDDALDKFNAGISTYKCINLCFRHGKSEISSRYLPAHFLGEHPDSEVMVVSHTDDKAVEFGGFGRMLMQSRQYHELYPRVLLSRTKRGVQEWGIEGHLGISQYTGIHSGSAGKGGALIVVDDFFGKRQHAESETLREAAWTSFAEDFITRRAPVAVVILVVTPWHVDDPVARIKKRMDKDPLFPHFDFVSFPAHSKIYPSGWLFPERFPIQWYTDEKAVLGTYGYNSLMQCDPKTRGGNFLRTDKIHIVDNDGRCSCGAIHSWPMHLRKKRGWDLASSVKETQKDDPDFTVGVEGAVIQIPTMVANEKIKTIYVEDVIRGQWEALQRQKIILSAAIADGHIEQGIEAFGGYKDSYTEIETILRGIRTVRKMQLPGDKQIKVDPMVAPFEAGNVYFRKAPWNEED